MGKPARVDIGKDGTHWSCLRAQCPEECAGPRAVSMRCRITRSVAQSKGTLPHEIGTKNGIQSVTKPAINCDDRMGEIREGVESVNEDTPDSPPSLKPEGTETPERAPLASLG